MSYHPSSLPAQTHTSGRALLRVLGALLSLVSVLLAAVGIFFHQNVPGLIFAGIVALFGLRVFVLWLGAGRVADRRMAGVAGASSATPLGVINHARTEFASA